MDKDMTFLEAHRFFIRESQHYVLGNWYSYAKTGRLRYVLRFPLAYIKFMRHYL